MKQKELDKAEIMFLAPLLPKAGEKAVAYIKDPFPFAIAFKRCGKRAAAQNLYWCGHCGGSFNPEELPDYRKNPKAKNPWCSRKHLATCPHCGRALQIEDNYETRARHFVDNVAVKCTFRDWEISRYYEVDTWCKAGKPEENAFRMVGSSWKRNGEVYEYFARQGGLFYSKYWKLNEPFRFADYSPLRGSVNFYSKTEHYKIPKTFDLNKELAMRGLDPKNMHGLRLSQALELMQADPHFETLWKQGEWEIAKFFKKDLGKYWPQIKIARRQGYKIADLNEWRDMIGFLRELHKDDYSPKYVCPADLHEAHNTLLEQAQRQRRILMEEWQRDADERRRIESERKYKDAKKEEGDFIERRKPYFGISIPSDKGFTIVVLQSIKEFKHEGDMLHHCVFHSAYYRREGSLILSARDSDNNPIETLEVSLDTFKILQCYGDHDTHTPLHESICKTMRANMWRVKEIANGLRMAC